MNFLLLFKSFILKITIIALIIKVFKKFSIFRIIWSFFNLILFSIFGISLIDIYEVEILSNFLHNILDIFSKIHTNILDLFGKKVEIPVEFPSKMGSMKRIDQSSAGNKESNKIIERFNKIIHNEPETIQEVEPIKEDTPLYKNKYVIIGGILVLSCLSWYFYDDIRPIGSSILTWINTFRPRPGPDANGSNESIQGNSKSNLSSLKDFVKEKIYGKDDSNPIPSNYNPSLNNKGKNIYLGELSQSEIERRGDLLQPQLSGLKDITGNSFTEESAAVLQEINAFLTHQEKGTFPNTNIKQGLYKLLKSRVLKLSESKPNQFTFWTNEKEVNNVIEKFANIENQVLDNLIHSPESHTYEEIALATIQEQDVWSEPALSPKPELLSPIPLEIDLKHAKERNQMDRNIITNNIDQIWPKEPSILDTAEININKDLKDSSKSSSPIKFGVSNVDRDQFIPEINIKKDSDSNSSMDHYFPKIVEPKLTFLEQSKSLKVEYVTPEAVNKEINVEQSSSNLIPPVENKPKLTFLEQINSRRLEYGTPILENQELKASPNIANVGLQTPIQDRLNTSPLIHKTSISNMFDDTMNLFEDDNNDIDISDKDNYNNQEFVQGSSNENKPQIKVENKPGYGKSFLDSINALRKEYNDSKIEKPELNEYKSPERYDDSEDDIIDSFDKIKVNIDNNNHLININLGEMNKNIKQIHTATNDGYLTSHELANLDNSTSGNISLPWDKRNTKYAKGSLIHEIHVTDFNGNTISIYKNDFN